MKIAASAAIDREFLAVFLHRNAMRLNRLSLSTSVRCSPGPCKLPLQIALEFRFDLNGVGSQGQPRQLLPNGGVNI